MKMAYSLSGERPSAAARPLHVLVALKAALAQWAAARRRRNALRALLDLDDYRLWDLGISRSDLTHATRSDDFDILAVHRSGRALEIWPPR
jgi:uncharacterized protein YjiS (DUF1127 family)